MLRADGLRVVIYVNDHVPAMSMCSVMEKLEVATEEQLAEVEILETGYGLH